MFHKKCVTDCGIWAGIDSGENIRKERQARASKAKNSDLAEDPFILDSPVPDFFRTEKSKERVRSFRSMVSSKRGVLSGCVCGDVSQNPTIVFRGGAWLPALARSSDLVLLQDGQGLDGHFYTAAEMACSQGWPAVPTQNSARYKSCEGYDLSQLTHGQQRSMQGNGMHLASWGSFVGFVLAHVIRRDVVCGLLPPIRSLPMEEEEEEGEEEG
jgi:hypothetical protein